MPALVIVSRYGAWHLSAGRAGIGVTSRTGHLSWVS